jgi:hypothetical protein
MNGLTTVPPAVNRFPLLLHPNDMGHKDSREAFEGFPIQ